VEAYQVARHQTAVTVERLVEGRGERKSRAKAAPVDGHCYDDFIKQLVLPSSLSSPFSFSFPLQKLRACSFPIHVGWNESC
jgi:hypothetical protein